MSFKRNLPALGLLLAACSPQSIEGPAQIPPPEESIQEVAPTQQVLGVLAPEEPLVAQPEPESESPRAEVVLPDIVLNPVSAWRPPPYQIPLAIRPTDHYYFTRPIPSGDLNWPNPRYRYGSTAFGEESTHTGVDLVADRSAPIVAAGDGEVIWVGYGLYGGVWDLSDPYGLAVAIRHDFGHAGQVLYSAYAHMESTNVWLGQRVSAGERIGTVGDTGHASGPHLHFEVRAGENRYFASRNPELWMVPAEGWGVLAGLVQDTWGRPMTEYLVKIKSLETEQIWNVWTYVLGTIQPDDYYQENFVIGDLPQGPYQLQIDFAGRSYTTFLYMKPGQTNFVEFNGRRGFTMEEGVASLTRSDTPPYP
jgi:murein DD-endopeptidase MepM/ murein hydrolase activator NlpD